MNESLKINVGCGTDSWGDVRTDVSRDTFWAMGKSSANLLADVRFMPFQDKSFDELRIQEVLEHIPDWKSALFECCRVSKKMLITVPVDSYMPRHYFNWFINLLTTMHPRRLLKFLDREYIRYVLKLQEKTKEHLWQFDVDVLTSLITKAGFQKVSVKTLYYPLLGVQGRHSRFFRGSVKKKARWQIVAVQE